MDGPKDGRGWEAAGSTFLHSYTSKNSIQKGTNQSQRAARVTPGFLLPQLQASGGPAVWTGLSLPPRKLSQPTGTELHFRQETPALAQGCSIESWVQPPPQSSNPTGDQGPSASPHIRRICAH